MMTQETLRDSPTPLPTDLAALIAQVGMEAQAHFAQLRHDLERQRRDVSLVLAVVVSLYIYMVVIPMLQDIREQKEYADAPR